MKKRVLILIALMAVLLLVAGPVHATRPPNAEGLWQYMPSIVGAREANGNTFLTTTEEGRWTGTFDGDSTEAGKVVIHSSGLWSFKAIVSFVGTVNGDGEWGTLEMSVVGKRPPESTDWEGKWVILSGTEDLANLRGQGTWWGPGYPGDPEDPDVWGNIWYSGNIHFEPE